MKRPAAVQAIDWLAVQTFYDAGHTRNACMECFGFSKRAWRKAVDLNLIVPRPPGTQVGPQTTRFGVHRGLAEGKSYSEIAKDLGVNKSTVAYHARRLGRPVDERFNRRYDWFAIQKAHDGGMRALECCRHFGFSRATWTSAVKRGDIVPRSHLIPLDQLLVRGRRTSRGHLKTRLLSAGLKENRCEECGLADWRGRPLGLQLLCPNCHAQTDTWGGRNGQSKRERHLKLVNPTPDTEAA